MVAGGALEVRPGTDDPGALALMGRLSTVSRRRWPVTAAPSPRLGVPPPKVPTIAPSAGPVAEDR